MNTEDLKLYRKKGTQPMAPYIPGDPLPEGCSVAEADAENGSPKTGDMIAVNPSDPSDTWLVAQRYFEDNYELAE